jgi:hypothetical protein
MFSLAKTVRWRNYLPGLLWLEIKSSQVKSSHACCNFPFLYDCQTHILLLLRQTVTGPVQRFARQIASHGFIVAAPSSYHEFTGPEPLAYDGPGTDKGNEWKITKVRLHMSTATTQPCALSF